MGTFRGTRRWLLVTALTVAPVGCGDDGLGPSTPHTLRIDAATIELRIGQRTALSFALLDREGREVATPSEWATSVTSTDSGVVTIGSDGTLVGQKVGTATISVTAGPLSEQASATVLAPTTTTDATAAVSATIDRAGGSITASAANGVQYTLAVPPGALSSPVQIRLAPLTSVAELPLSGGLVAGVEFSPDGLEFRRPALLTIVAAQPADRGLVGFHLSGDEFRLVPARIRSDSMTLMIGHFSGAGVADGSADEVTDLAGIPSPYPEEEAMQDLAAVIATAGESGGSPDREQLQGILLDWFVSSVLPALNDAATNPELLEDALSEFARWESAIALWADGLMEAQIEVGRTAAANALRVQVQRLNQQCAAENDWSPVADMLELVAIAELMGLATQGNGLQTDQVLADLCVQVQIMEATLPETIEASGPIELEVQAGLVIGGRSPVFEPALNVDASGGSTALVSPPRGSTDGSGRFTADVSLQNEATDARVDVVVSFPELPAVSATRSLTAEGQVSLEFGGRPSGSNGTMSNEVEIENGADAQLMVTLLKGRGGHIGREVVLELDGPGSLNETSVAIDAEGTRLVWYTAPELGSGEARVIARFVEGGELLTAQVTIRFGGRFEPVDLTLDFGTGEANPTVAGPVLAAGVEYRIFVSGTFSIWTGEWQNGPCKGSPGSGAGGPTGLDAESWFAIPRGSSLCGSSFDCCPSHSGKFRMNLDGTSDFDHVHAVSGEQYNPSHSYEYRVVGQGQPIRFMLREDSARGDDYGVLTIRIEKGGGPGTAGGEP